MKTILDACCGSRMFWFDRQHPDVVFMDCREESHILCDGRALEIKPDVVGDFRKMPFSDGTFRLVVFDPPHLLHAGENSWLARKYGKLDRETWREDLKAGFPDINRAAEISLLTACLYIQKPLKINTVQGRKIQLSPTFGEGVKETEGL